ncbi:MAG TPA: hypothetical protein VF142_15145, partial [Longimicrobium sp.]
DPRAGLNREERLAYDQIEAFAEAKERADRRQAAEARLHEIADHRDNLAAAEANIPRAKAALKSEVEGVFADGAKAMEGIEAALERDGPAETARRVRSGELLKNEQKKIIAPKRTFGVIPRRDRAAETEARERVAQRIETIGYYERDLGKWSTFQPQDGPAVHGAKNVRAALDREEAQVAANSGIGRASRWPPARSGKGSSRRATKRWPGPHSVLNRFSEGGCWSPGSEYQPRDPSGHTHLATRRAGARPPRLTRAVDVIVSW